MCELYIRVRSEKKEKLTPAHDDAPYLRADALLALPHKEISKYKQIQIALAREAKLFFHKRDIILSLDKHT
jgi:hypothetical protein